MTILGHDFKHQLIVDYSSSNTCDTSGCIEEGICRCTELYDCHVKSVRVDQISNIIFCWFLGFILSNSCGITSTFIKFNHRQLFHYCQKRNK